MEKRLYRSTEDRTLGGVCGGIAEYFGIDPVIVRLIAVLALVLGVFPAFVAYLLLWIVVPENSNKKKV